ncbi:heterokaryon incompatibility protein-domain-containing protein [Xylariales sp. AK1849]|nr:heterokaryon incompatibility protein-domain-containing protein [Xylariales sp. AK1849]
MTTYQYQPLDTEMSEIRLLTILPGDFHDEIHIALKHVYIPMIQTPGPHHPAVSPKSTATSLGVPTLLAAGWDENDEDDEEDGDYEDDQLDEDEDEMDVETGDGGDDRIDEGDQDADYVEGYEALSYVWGAADDQKHVFVESTPIGNNTISLTKNLEIALRYLRLKARPRVMWVDAICINQADDVEKGHQVSIMGSIYRTANDVAVWIGPEEDDSNHAMGLIADLGRKVVVDWYNLSISPSEAGRDERHWADESQELDYGERGLRAICLLLSRNWFRRLWVRQEIYLAKSAALTCGHVTMSWSHFENAVYCLKVKPFQGSVLGDLRGRWRELQNRVLDLCDSSHTSESYEGLRFTLRGVEWTNPKDAIYAVSNLLHHEDYSLGVRPDYTKPTARIYEDVVLRIIESQRSLSFLATCEINGRATLGLPSWVPDWSTHIRTPSRFPPRWSACGWISSQAHVPSDDTSNRVLRAPGIRVSHIEKVHPLDVNENAFDQTRLCNCIKRLVDQEDLEAYCPGGSCRLEACCRTFYACHSFAEDCQSPLHTSLPLNHGKEALQSICSWEAVPESIERHVRHYLAGCFESFIGRSFFSTSDGHIGLAPRNSLPGDAVCILLGSRLPIILRQSSTTPPRWQVVGACFVPGFMNGEAIYGSLPAHYTAVTLEWNTASGNTGMNFEINNEWVALLDQRNGSLKTNPGEILAEMGIPCAKYQKKPYILEVLPEKSREAGVQLQDFDLV